MTPAKYPTKRGYPNSGKMRRAYVRQKIWMRVKPILIVLGLAGLVMATAVILSFVAAFEMGKQ